MSSVRAHLPQQVPIEAYGNGGFRFGGMSHRGSVLCLPTGIWEWQAASMETLDRGSFADVLATGGALSIFLLGTGRSLVPPSRDLRQAFTEAGLWLEFMDTGAAARTYNVLLAEGRTVGAGLLAVD